MKFKVLSLILIGIVFSACSVNKTQETSIPIVPTVEGSGIELLITKSAEIEQPTVQVINPTSTETAVPVITEEPVPDPVEFTPFSAVVWANGVNLRTNPGYLFPSLRLLEENSTVQVLGRSPGNEWIYVLSQDNTYGWIYAQLLESDTAFTQAPLVEPGEVLIIKGTVTLPDGTPASGIHFAINRGTLRNDAVTDENGLFTAFMPKDSIGIWNVSFVAISCTSNTMDENCNCSGVYCGPTSPETTTITLPSDQILQFVWE